MKPLGTPPATPARTVWRAGDRWAALGSAAAYVGLGLLCKGRPRGPERRLFQAANYDREALPLLRVPSSSARPGSRPPLLAALGLFTHRPHLAVTGALAVPLEKALEVGLKKALGRERPSQVDPDAELHDDAPTEGPSYPSGHAAIAFSSVLLAAPYLPVPATGTGLAVAGVASWVRVQQGAHFPLDAAGGALLGVLVVSSLTAVIGRPAVPRPLLPGAGTS